MGGNWGLGLMCKLQVWEVLRVIQEGAGSALHSLGSIFSYWTVAWASPPERGLILSARLADKAAHAGVQRFPFPPSAKPVFSTPHCDSRHESPISTAGAHLVTSYVTRYELRHRDEMAVGVFFSFFLILELASD